MGLDESEYFAHFEDVSIFALKSGYKLCDAIHWDSPSNASWYIKVQDMIGDRYINILTASSQPPWQPQRAH